ncbi:hypothetical protein ACGF5C_22715 [Micromonospora sp. NPDC047620]|uniref:hypothetical protein n=1 Tax=Micromonospora sp. NPDC047620 TaxID=3364251 RepID=UPI003710F4AA
MTGRANFSTPPYGNSLMLMGVWEAAPMDEAERIAYFQADEPPREWLDWVAHQLWPDVDFGEAGVRRLAEHGIGAAR